MDQADDQADKAVELFVADRQKFWTSFTSFTTFAAGALVVLLILMAIFLV